MLAPRRGDRALSRFGSFPLSDAARPKLKISREGIVLIKSFEGFRPRAIQRAEGGWVIGYGHTLSAREGATVSEADAELLLRYDLLPIEAAVNATVPGPLNQHQFDALASFAFSVGLDRFAASDVRQSLAAGASGEAADALMGWPEPVSPEAALRRRAAERALFVADPAAPVALVDLLTAPLTAPVQDTASELPVSTGEDAGTDTVAAAEGAGPVPAVRDAAYGLTVSGPLPDIDPISAEAASPPLPSNAGETPPAPGGLVGQLVVTPSEAAAKPALARPLATDEARPDTYAADSSLIGEDATLTLGSVMRHENRIEARKAFDWKTAAPFLLLGVAGLVTFGASMAAFRSAIEYQGEPDQLLIGGGLAVVGLGCVAVSALVLYRKFGLPRGD